MSFKSRTPSAQWKLFLKVWSSAEEGGERCILRGRLLEVLGKSVRLGYRRHTYQHATIKSSAAAAGGGGRLGQTYANNQVQAASVPRQLG